MSFFTTIVGFLCVGALTSEAPAQQWILQSPGVTASLRGVSVVSRRVAWASGAQSTCLRTLDGGETWRTSGAPGADDLDFRAVHALDSRTAWLMSSGPGAKSRIFKTADGGAHWSLLYVNPDAAGFLDALAFWDARRGVVLGDPVNGEFVILITADGGQTWQRRKLPPAFENEGAFAASNSCLQLRGKREIWFATGGPSGARVFHSKDSGETWEVARTPLCHDSAAAGIFSLAFADSLDGIAVGGNYGKPADHTANVAATTDGGRTWIATEDAPPNGYRSSVAYVSARRVWIAVGTSGSDMSSDGGRSWRSFDSGRFNALAVFRDAVWAVGPDGRIARLRWQ